MACVEPTVAGRPERSWARLMLKCTEGGQPSQLRGVVAGPEAPCLGHVPLDDFALFKSPLFGGTRCPLLGDGIFPSLRFIFPVALRSLI